MKTYHSKNYLKDNIWFLQACQFGYYPSCLSAGLLDSANPYSEVIKIPSQPMLFLLRFLRFSFGSSFECIQTYERKVAPNPAKAKEAYK